MDKIKILYQLNQLGYGGTEKAILAFLENIDRTIFDPYLFVYSLKGTPRYYRHLLLKNFSKKYKKSFQAYHVNSIAKLPDFEKTLGKERIYFGTWKNFEKLINELKPDIVHVNRGNEKEFYTGSISTIPSLKKLVETNIFARKAGLEYWKRLDKTYFVSHYCKDKSPWHDGKGDVLYNPIQKSQTTTDLRNKYRIPKNAVVIGQIGRPDLEQDELVYESFINLNNPNAYLIVIGCIEKLKQLKKPNDNIILIEATADRSIVDQFFNTIDILVHRRLDGETFGMNIAEAMINGKPVVSHLCSVDNAQAELLDDKLYGPVGFITDEYDWDGYKSNLKKLFENENLRQSMGHNARNKALALFDEKVVTRDLEKKYLSLLKN